MQLNASRDLITAIWPSRHEAFGVRIMLRSMIRHARRLRDEGSA